ncbi:MAG: glutathione S-transferase family protein [Myxococcota bacterium]
MKIYSSNVSPNARRVRLVALELGLTPDIVEIDVFKGEHRAPDYLTVNPHGRIPAFQDSGLELSESRAVSIHLTSTVAQQTLWPSDPAEQAQVLHWMFWDAAHFAQRAQRLQVLRMFTKDPSPKDVEEATSQFEAEASVMDARLGDRSFLVGSELTLADISIGATLTYAGPAEFPLAKFPALVRWFDALRKRDSWKATEPVLPGS